MPEFSRIEEFKVLAFGDKFVINDEIRYLPFFEADEPYRGGISTMAYSVWPTPNGFHIVGEKLTDAEGKRRWFELWAAQYPSSDYKLNNWNFLRPASFEEAACIFRLAPRKPKMVRYYRDKKVFENWVGGQSGGENRLR